MTSTNTIVDVAKIFKKENKHVWIYASNFEEYRRFFVETLTEEAIIAMFLNNVRNALKIHAISIKRSKPSWNVFLKRLVDLIMKNPEQRQGLNPRIGRQAWPLRSKKAGGKPVQRRAGTRGVRIEEAPGR